MSNSAAQPKLGIKNPYLDEFNSLGHKRVSGFSHFSLDHYRHRERMVKQYAWAIPNQIALDTIAKYGSVVDIGAGLGYWAYCLQQMGVDVVAYDLIIKGENHYTEGKPWTEVLEGAPEVASYYPQRTLFLCWPPYEDPMATDCLKFYEGNTVIYVGEGSSGCTGDYEFHHRLNHFYAEVEGEEYVHIPQWDGIHDYLSVWKRKLPNDSPYLEVKRDFCGRPVDENGKVIEDEDEDDSQKDTPS